MMSCRSRSWGRIFVVALAFTISACTKGPPSDPVAPTTQTVRIAGSVTGLKGSGLVLQNNAGADLAVAAAADSFAFVNVLKSSNYAVSVKSQPTSPWQTCAIGNGSGVASGNVSGLTLTCATNSFAVRGTVAGVTGTGMTLLINGGSSQSIAAGTSTFSFAGVLSGTAFAITVGTQPVGQSCSVSNGAGTMSGTDVSTVSITCVALNVRIGGAVRGLKGSGLVLQNNAGSDLAVTAAADSFFFANVPGNSTYAVTVKSQPTAPWQTCTIGNGTGVASANVSGLTLTCATNDYAVRGSIAGLTGTGLTLLINAGSSQAIAPGASTFTFAGVSSGTAFAVTIGTQPAGLTCAVINGTGTMSGADVSTVSVSCATLTVTIGGPALVGSSGLSLRLNGGTPLIIDASATSYTFPNALPVGTPWNITVASQPQSPLATCITARGRGITSTTNVTNVQVQCYSNGGLSGLSGTYTFNLGGRRSFVTAWADGTLSIALFNEDASCLNNGNGAEYGSYRRQASGTFQPWATKLDQTGDCGLFNPSLTPGTGPVGTLTRAGNVVTLTWEGFTIVMPAVESVPTSLVGAFTRADGNDGSFIVFESDGTYTYLDAQDASPNGGTPGGFERGCYTVSGATFTTSLASSCKPNGLSAFDGNGTGGFSGKNGAPIPFAITSATTVTIGGVPYVRSTPGG